MKLKIRTHDAVAGNSNLDDLYSMPKFPVFMGCVNHKENEDIFSEFTWQISRDSGLIQLKNLIPLDILYSAEHHSGVIGDIWLEHHKKFSQFLRETNPKTVFEIGGAHGILSKEYFKFRQIPWTILEPNPSPVDGCEARFIKGFFDSKIVQGEKIETVVHSHVLEHIYEPHKFMQDLAKITKEGNQLVFSVPNMKVMLERNYTNCLNFEHTIFLTEPYIEFLLAKYGFRLIRKEYFMEDHSIFYAAKRDTLVKPFELPSALYSVNKNLFNSYIEHHKNMISDLNKIMDKISQPIYLFGAHIFSQFLLVMGLDTSKIVCLLDNDIQKKDRRLYGTSLVVRSPKILAEIHKPVVILKAGVYNEEIKNQILININKDVIFL